MTWRNKIEQLVGLLEKIPQPKKFESKAGVYEPYFVLELRSSNWEITPYANYTRLDGSPGREVRLTLAVVDNSKVNINQNELNCLIYLHSNSNSDSRRIFNYTQSVGFLLDWLSSSCVMVKDLTQKSPTVVSFHPEKGKMTLRLLRSKNGYRLQPSLVFSESVLDIEGPAVVLTSNPIYLLYRGVLYRIESALPSMFWSNYFRIYENFEIPLSELNDFIRVYLPHILPVLDWANLSEHIKRYQLPLSGKCIYFSEENNHLSIHVKFQYGDFEFPAMPPSDHSLANEGSYIFIVERDQKEESQARHILEEHGLIYSSGHWHIAIDYNPLDWMRLEVPELARAGFTILGEEKLSRYRVHHRTPRLRLKAKSGIDWLDLKYELVLGNKAIEIPDLLRQIRSGKQYVKLADGSHVYLPTEFMERIKKLASLVELRDGKGRIRLPAAGIMLLQEIQSIAEDMKLDTHAQEILLKYQNFQEIQSVIPPQGLVGTLRNYQKSGLDWLHFLHEFHFGGILADDMGLGKTVQIIALLQKLKEAGVLQNPTLIIVPLTLIFNWAEEFQKFAPRLRILRYHGNRSDRLKMLAQFADYDAVLCSYGVVLQDQKHLSRQTFDYIILDESQKIKNPQTKTYRAINKLRAPHKLALTGTPVENSMLDLWAQFNFVNPGLLGSLSQFQERYMEAEHEEQKERLESLKKLIYPFILRRTKEEVEKQLPPLTEIVQHIEMTERQRRIYHKWLNYYRHQIFNQLNTFGINKTRLKIVEALTYLRQIACHPAILNNEVDLWESGKIQLLEDMLEDVLVEGHKVLIFSQFVRFLKLVRTIFDERGWRYEYLDGKVRDRDKRIHNFQENPKISAFLISLKAGGLGLNLTAADYVIHLDPWWNPAVEQQATDRAHRIGQDKRVFVYKYIVKDTVEEKILQLQRMKKEISDQLITSDMGFVKKLTRGDLEQLFELRADKQEN